MPTTPVTADWIAWAESELDAVSDSARLDAELLLAATARLSRAAVIADPGRRLSRSVTERLAAKVGRRSRGEPVAYILGRKEFYSLDLIVSSDVLVPRPETELLVDAALERLGARDASVLDVGTGAGAIALALKHARAELDVVAVDSSEAALSVARCNAEAHGLRIEWQRSDWFASLEPRPFDVIVSNPPYVRSNDPAFAGPLQHEPRAALDGGVDGLDAYRAILSGASSYLAEGGQLLLEHGFDQREAVIGLAERHRFELRAAIDDLAGRPRVACFARRAP